MISKKKAPAKDRGKELSTGGDSSSSPTISEVGGKVKPVNVDGETLRIRDRRKRGFFTISNKVMGWAPVIGPTGLAVYAYLCYRANEKQSEKAWPSYKLACAELAIGQNSFNRYVRLLQCCGLVATGREKTPRGWHNTYYLLEEPSLTEHTLAAMRDVVQEEFAADYEARFLASVLKRIDKVLDSTGNKGGVHYQVTDPIITCAHTLVPTGNEEQDSHEHPDEEIFNPAPENLQQQHAESGRKTPTNGNGNSGDNANVAVVAEEKRKSELLKSFNVANPKRQNIVESPGITGNTIERWIDYIRQQDGIKNPAGLLIAKLESGESPSVNLGGQRWYTDEDYRDSFVQPGQRPGGPARADGVAKLEDFYDWGIEGYTPDGVKVVRSFETGQHKVAVDGHSTQS